MKTAIYVVMLLGLCLAGCSRADKDADKSQSQESAKTQLESLQKIAAQTAQTYKAMDNDALLKKLVEQSTAKREPFNSLAYRELRGRKDVNADALVSLVREMNNGNALLPLLLIRRLNERTYLDMAPELRATVLTDALQTSRTFNTWGLPHAYLEDASKAMLESGESAYPALRRMLSDTRPAPVFGSKEFMEYQRYKYRLCDYALFFLEKMQGNAGFVMPMSVADRDALISGLLK
jgi:hypothetical protein